MITETVRERLLSQLIIDPDGCLLWTGGQGRDVYGRIWINGRQQKVHRVVWELWEGPISPGLELDHVRARGCTHKNCASIAHLEPVTHQENTLRSQVMKTHCPHGHEFTPENTVMRRGRECRTCRREGDLRYNETHRAERAAFTRAWRARKKAAG